MLTLTSHTQDGPKPKSDLSGVPEPFQRQHNGYEDYVADLLSKLALLLLLLLPQLARWALMRDTGAGYAEFSLVIFNPMATLEPLETSLNYSSYTLKLYTEGFARPISSHCRTAIRYGRQLQRF